MAIAKRVGHDLVTDSYGQVFESPASYVSHIFDREMGVTLENYRKRSPRDKAMRKLTEEAVNLYTKRVLRELIQNAFDGAGGVEAKIFVRLDRREGAGVLQVANTGRGFTSSNVDAVSSPALSNKTPGNYIGHKGLGFRSVELLSDEVEILSMRGAGREGAPAFDGFRFRFANPDDQRLWLEKRGEGTLAKDLVDRVHRLQLPVPLAHRVDDRDRLAGEGYATLIHLPLRDVIATEAASEEIDTIISSEAPVSLFLQGLRELTIVRIGADGVEERHVLTRETKGTDLDLGLLGAAVEEVTAEGRRHLVARMRVDDDAFRASVSEAVAKRYKVAQWAEWVGTPEVSVALSLGGGARSGVVYAFLPMTRVSPFNGYVDAPFHPDADRKDILMDNPLNRFLMGQVAELCVRLALAISKSSRNRPETEAAVVDAIAWKTETDLIKEACERIGLEVGKLPLPAMRRGETGDRWSSLDEIYDWRDQDYQLLKRSFVVRVCSLPVLPGRLGPKRVEALEEFADAVGFILYPLAESWKEWAPAIAAHLTKKKKLDRPDWEAFYADLAGMPDALQYLHGTAIFRLEDGSLAPANEVEHEGERQLFIAASAEGETVRNRRKLGSAAPPESVMKRILIADQGLTWPPAVATAFIQAKLATRYDLARVLARLRSLLGPRPRQATITAALGWAFHVWKNHRSPEIEQAIKGAGLSVPVVGGGHKQASKVYFGNGWRDTRGTALAEFLALVPEELASVRTLREGLLPNWEDWPLADRGSASDWVSFLGQLGVREGPVAQFFGPVARQVDQWVSMRRSNQALIPHEAGLGPWWRVAIRSEKPWSIFKYQSGQYSTEKTLYVVPGQAAQPDMEERAKLAYARLLVAALPDLGGDRFRTTLARTAGNSDRTALPSPLAAFLKLAEWLPVAAEDGVVWRRPDQCWYAPRGDQWPRFIPRINRAARDNIDTSKSAREILVSKLGLRLWNEPSSAPARLAQLGECAADGIAEADLDAFRKAHREAWEDWIALEPRPALPDDLLLVIEGSGRPAALEPSEEDGRQQVYIGDGSDTAREQLIVALGHKLLHVPAGSAATVADALKRIRTDEFILLEDAQLTIRADGEEIAPGAEHSPIAGEGREWLAEIAVLVLEFNDALSSRNTARSRQTLYDAFMRLRVVFASKITVEVGGTRGPLPSPLGGVLALPDAANPTMLIEGAAELDWPVLSRLARSFASALRKPSLHLAFQLAFLKLSDALASLGGGLSRPSDEQVAQALGHPVGRAREVKRSLRSANRSLLELLIPIVHAMGGPEPAAMLREQEDKLVEDTDVEALLVSKGIQPSLARRMIAAARSADSLDDLRRQFDIPLVKFNESLIALGSPWEALDLGDQLRRQFDKWLGGNRTGLEQRVRDRFLPEYQNGGDLSPYVAALSLGWITFDEGWVRQFDEIPDDAINARIELLLAEHGADPGPSSAPPIEEVRGANRKLLISNVEKIARIAGAWAAKAPDRSIGDAFGKPAEQIGRLAVASGLLDFEVLTQNALPGMLSRAGLWPTGMKPTLDFGQLGLDEHDLQKRREKEEKDRREIQKQKRTVTFGTANVDGGLEGRFQLVAQALEAAFESKGFQKRSGEANLLPLAPGGGGGGGNKEGWKRTKDPEYSSEEQRVLLGFAGELAAYRYLKKTLRAFSDDYWISSMGRQFLGLSPMGDNDGFDFHVRRSKGPDLYYEVKAHTGDPGYVDLERSQVQAALTFADEKVGIWRILYVPFVREPDLISVQELCNPYGNEGKHLFRQSGRESVRLEMRRG